LRELSDVAKDSTAAVFVNFHGLSVGDTNTLRAELREKGVQYRVAKKTLIRKAFNESSIAGELPALDGELAVAWSMDDATAPAREVYTFQKKHEGKVSILGGVFESAYLDQTHMMDIATIPPMEVLRGMFVNVINSPIQGLVIALNAIAEQRN